jgi:hypothetical protein
MSTVTLLAVSTMSRECVTANKIGIALIGKPTAWETGVIVARWRWLQMFVARKFLSYAFAPAVLIAELAPESVESFLVR